MSWTEPKRSANPLANAHPSANEVFIFQLPAMNNFLDIR